MKPQSSEIKIFNKNRAEKIIRSLEKRYMKGYYFENTQEAVLEICKMIKKGDVVGLGGSETIIETGLIDELRKLDIKLLDRYTEEVSKEEVDKMRIEGLLSDVFIASTNAITIDGKLVNQDGIGNRVAAMIFGPKKVIIIAGMNKVVPTVEDAIRRIKSHAGPLDALRVNVETPCYHTGICNESHCYPPKRICGQLAVIESSTVKDRITVVLVGDNYGY